jgi:hypothetical protein
MASARSSSRSSSNPFLDKDGLINVAAFTTFAREIDKVAVKDGLKPAELYFSKTAIPKFDAAKAKAAIDLYVRKRHTPTGTKARVPPTGARVRMVVLLRNYKGFLDNDAYSEFHKDFAKAQKALETHNKLAERFQEKHKAGAAKKREAANKDFDKNLDSLMDLLTGKAGVDEKNIAIGTSMMGKTVIFKLPNGGYVSVGKADAERFKKAKESANAAEEPKAASKSGRTKAAAAEPAKRGRTKAAPAAEPAKRSRSSSKAAAAEESRSSRSSSRASSEKTSSRSSRRSSSSSEKTSSRSSRR